MTSNWYLSLDPIDPILQDLASPPVAEAMLNSDVDIESSFSSGAVIEDAVSYKLIAVKNIDDSSLFRFELILSTLNNLRKDMAIKYLQKDSYFRLCVKGMDSKDYWLTT